MIGYFLNPKQIEWVKNNIRDFSQKAPDDVKAILVADNQGFSMRQIVLFIRGDDGEIAKYEITSFGSAWHEDDSPFKSLAEAQTNYEMDTTIERLQPSTLRDNDNQFEELKRLIRRR